VVALTAVGGYFVLTVALVFSFGLPSLPALALLLLLLALLLLVARWHESADAEARARRWLGPAVRGVAILHFAGFCLVTLGLARSAGVPLAPVAVGLLVFGLVLGSYLSSEQPPRWLRGRFAGLLAAAGLLGGCQIELAPPPTIDTWGFQQEAARFLLRGDNPYDSAYPHMGDEDYYAPSSVVDGQMQTYPYMPLQLVLTLPGYLLGDVRWVMLAALLGSAAFTAAAGDWSQASQTAAALLLCNPLNPLIIAQSWSEPLVTCAVAACLWAALRRCRWLGVALGGLLGVKQYAVLAALPLWAARRVGWRTTAAAVALAVATVVPFLMWDPTALWRGVVGHHLDVALRTNSLCMPAAVATYCGWQLPGAIGFGAALLAAVIGLGRRPASLGRALLGGTAVVLAFFLLGKGGHLNYYWFTGSLLPLALAADTSHSAASSGGTQKNVASR
jgi:hypothetical protein